MNPVRDQNYVALDLELNSPQDDKPPRIIQVGVAVGSPAKPEDIETRCWYLDPEEQITEVITDLTGISDADILQYAVPHEIFAANLRSFLATKECFINPVTWGQGDVHELKSELKSKQIHFPVFGRRIFDVKTLYVFNQMARGKSVAGGLKKAMGAYGLKFEGTPHRADIDALNTLRFFFHLLKKERATLEAINALKEI